jgi:2-oxo-4-hydroxy-4-carboxy-5-ureidoimidazoline decarboxylase
MAAARPFPDEDAMHRTAERAFDLLEQTDWLEAFRAHPRIGDRETLRSRFRSTHEWSMEEQRGAAGAPDEVLDALEAGNQAYENRFGHIFIVCATGKTAAEMLSLLRSRLENDPATELRIAAAEQRKITYLRLEKLSVS